MAWNTDVGIPGKGLQTRKNDLEEEHEMMNRTNVPIRLFMVSCLLLSLVSASAATAENGPLLVEQQGSFAVGGTVVTAPGDFELFMTDPAGQTCHGDHAYVFYQVPVNARKLPMVLWHGYGQSSKTWESTPDGREGYQNIFLRRGFGVYLMDQPRRGKAGRSATGAAISAKADEQFWFNQFRVGTWPDFYPGVQFSKDPEALNQFFRQMTPDTGPIDVGLNADAVAALFDKIGEGILVTHSHSGGMGWEAVLKSPEIRAVVSYEPGSNFIFPEGEVPDPVKSQFGDLKAASVPMDEFRKLTRIPVVMYYGDNIPQSPSADRGKDQWRIRLTMARKWAGAVNRHGGDATVVHLPEVGVFGNTHFPFSDTNNLEVADLLSAWLEEKGLN